VALIRSAEHGVYVYTIVPDELVAALAAWQMKRNGVVLEGDWIVRVPGVVPSLHYAIEAYTREGEGVVVQSPVYRPFYRAVETLGRRLVLNPLREDGKSYRMDLDQLESVIDGGTKLLLLCSPHNPVGRVWTEKELRDLGELCLAKGVTIVSDEIHSDLIMPGYEFVPILSLGEKIAACSVSCSAPSKTFNIPGTGCALVAIPDPGLRERFRRSAARACALGDMNLFSTTASLAAYRTGEDWLDALIPYLAENHAFLKDYLASELPSVKAYPLERTYVPCFDFRAYGLGAEELAKIVREAGVKLSDGAGFGPGGAGFERINIACPRTTLEEGCRRIAAAFGSKGLR